MPLSVLEPLFKDGFKVSKLTGLVTTVFSMNNVEHPGK